MPIGINIEKAKEIKKEQIRELRKPLLQELDLEFIKAMEKGDSKDIAEIAAKKQALRDATQHPSITQATTVEDLKSSDPISDILN